MCQASPGLFRLGQFFIKAVQAWLGLSSLSQFGPAFFHNCEPWARLVQLNEISLSLKSSGFIITKSYQILLKKSLFFVKLPCIYNLLVYGQHLI